MTLFSEPTPNSPKKRIAGLVFLAIFVAATVGLVVLPTPYVIEQPGPVVNVLGTHQTQQVISIEDAKWYPTKGALDLLTVNIVGTRDHTPSWPELLLAWLDPQKAIIPIDEVFPINQTQQQNDAESQAMMEQSQQDAIYVALTKLGYKVPTHIYVSEVKKNAPSSKKIVAGDYIESINGEAPATIDGLRDLINKYGDKALDVKVLREGKELHYSILPALDSQTQKLMLGIFVGYKYDFPIKVNLQLSDIGGPSGGTMFALGIYDRLTPGALTGGENIAGTGTIDASGAVGPIGGIQQKMYGAKNAGAKYFLAPEQNCGEVVGHVPDGLKLFKVATFDQALSVVEAIGQHQDLSKFATCTK